MRKDMGRKYRERMIKTRTILSEKTKEALASVLPILLIVLNYSQRYIHFILLTTLWILGFALLYNIFLGLFYA